MDGIVIFFFFFFFLVKKIYPFSFPLRSDDCQYQPG